LPTITKIASLGFQIVTDSWGTRGQQIGLGASESQAAANAAAGFDETPIGYTCHHDENVGLMQLIEEDAHSSFPHTGGFSLGNQ
jgi:A nuclease of the HNH/ENDO VII superfamily with conserved WHH